MLTCTLTDAYNVQADLIILAAKLGITAGPGIDTFTLEDIRLYVPAALPVFPSFYHSDVGTTTSSTMPPSPAGTS
jgi:hypothetical protein